MNKILLASDTINRSDINALNAWLSHEPIPQLTKGKLTVQYEEKYAHSCGRKYSVFVNSGSSANLLAIYGLITTKRLKNNLVVVPALGWITTIAPVIQLGLTPLLCDINFKDLSVCPTHLERIFIEQAPACLFMVSVLGMVPDVDTIIALCKKYQVMLIMDNCESQGSTYQGNDIQTYGLLSTCSSYYGHISSTVEGGTISTDDEELYNTLKMLRSHGWDRDIAPPMQDKLREQWQVPAFNSLYTFYYAGFNVRNNDIGAFLGLRQLDRLADMVRRRHYNFRLYNSLLKNDYWLPDEAYTAPRDTCSMPPVTCSITSNLGYPIIHPKRDAIVEALKQANIEHRPLVSGAMGTQPYYVNAYGATPLPNATVISQYGLYVPNHHLLTDKDVERVCGIVNEVINANC